MPITPATAATRASSGTADEPIMLELVDEAGNTIGTAEKLSAHQAPGQLHRAFSVFLFDETGRLLLQQRALGKYHSPGVWSNTCCGHPYPGESPFAAAARRTYEELGLCEPGGSGDLLDSGATAIGGRIPVNPSGGLLSKGEPLGASALGQVIELVRQLRGACGPRQVNGAKVALAHTIGRGANASATILTR